MVAHVDSFAAEPIGKIRADHRARGLIEALEPRTLLSATLFVTTSVPGDSTHFGTLQGALAVAVSGDTIVLQSGTLTQGVWLATANGGSLKRLIDGTFLAIVPAR